MKDFNFFEYSDEKIIKKKREKILLGLAAAIIFLIILPTSLYFYFLNNVNRDINSLKAEINLKENIEVMKQYDTTVTSEEILTKYRDVTKKLRETLERKSKISTELFDIILVNTPKEVEFKSLVINEDNIDIQGSATNRTTIAEFTHYLENIEAIENIKIASISGVDLESNGNLNFTIICKLKDVVNYETK
ncbi:PilN domain-containing protein [Clostridium sp.]|uniref:PilN domain-containing protein n=1 Tax=Clostridium sp. TaxID=1506 RepID=UPI002FC9302D